MALLIRTGLTIMIHTHIGAFHIGGAALVVVLFTEVVAGGVIDVIASVTAFRILAVRKVFCPHKTIAANSSFTCALGPGWTGVCFAVVAVVAGFGTLP